MSSAREDTAMDKFEPAEETVDTENADLDISDGPAAKRVALGHATALAGLTLQVVMQFAGKNDGVFVASVCRAWKKSYKSTFDDKIITHRAAGVMSVQRVHWIWHRWTHRKKPCRPRYRGREKDASWYVGKYAPRSVLEKVIDEGSPALNSDYFMQGIASSGRVDLVHELWIDLTPGDARLRALTTADVADEAAQCGHLRVFGYAWAKLDPEEEDDLGKEHIPECGVYAAQIAARKGFVHILEFLSQTDWWSSPDNGPLSPHSLGRIAAANNRVAVLRWLLAHGLEWDDRASLGAAARGTIPTINFLLENNCTYMDSDFVGCCIQYGRMETLQWCYNTLRPRVPDLWTTQNLEVWMLLAGAYDRKDLAKFLLEHGAVWPDIGAAFGQDMSCYDDDTGCYSFEDCSPCVWSVSFLEWAMSEGCTLGSWSTATCARLVRRTDWDTPSRCHLLGAITWAHKHGCVCACPRVEPDF